MNEYYNLSSDEVRKKINHHLNPLSSEEAKKNLQKYGYNELREGKRKGAVTVFLEQFKDFLVIILILAAIVSDFLGEPESTVVILVVITINALLGTVQTIKAEQSLSSLKALSSPEAKVIRDGIQMKIPGKEVTVGDVVNLEAGDFVPADGRILESASLKIDESALTGESIGVDKISDQLDGHTALGDQINMVFSGSFVTYGRGSFLVTKVAMDTEVGKIAALLKNTSERKTPLQSNLDQFGQRLSVLILVFCGILFAINVIRGESVGSAFLFAVALAVAAIPEALSSIVTIVLSFGTQKMARENAIVRKLQAVEGLGSVSVICSDKTGTLTQNKMTVEYYYTTGGCKAVTELDLQDESQKRLMEFSMLCSDATNIDGNEIGDPTETALLKAGNKVNLSYEKVRKEFTRVSEIPFDSDRKLMSVLCQDHGTYTMITKGAIDTLLLRIKQIDDQGVIRDWQEEDRKKILKQNDDFSANGLRVLTVAYRSFPAAMQLQTEDEKEMVFLGLIAMMDPPRDEAAAAVKDCIRSGIKPVMITGDHKVTAAAIAKRIGILKELKEACNGEEIDGLSDEELRKFVPTKAVYARVSPEHKIRIVRAWQEEGNIVAMTGDGVNDAPALKQADIGVAMGITGSEVSKDAAAVVLTDDNFATIIKAVENGRNVYANIKHAIGFLLSGNFGGILAVLYAAVAGLPVPFAPVHLLFINLLTDSLPAIALGLEPHDKIVMNENPRPVNESILTKRFLGTIGFDGLIIGMTSISAFYIGFQDGDAVLASTMAFGTLCLSRLVHGFNCKADYPVLFSKKFFNNQYLIGAFCIGFLFITAVLAFPVWERVFKVQALAFDQLLIVYVMSLVNLVVIQLKKVIQK